MVMASKSRQILFGTYDGNPNHHQKILLNAHHYCFTRLPMKHDFPLLSDVLKKIPKPLHFKHQCNPWQFNFHLHYQQWY
jgi:hypothetical protein